MCKNNSKQNHATFGHLSNHNKDLSILCSYRYFNYMYIPKNYAAIYVEDPV